MSERAHDLGIIFGLGCVALCVLHTALLATAAAHGAANMQAQAEHLVALMKQLSEL